MWIETEPTGVSNDRRLVRFDRCVRLVLLVCVGAFVAPPMSARAETCADYAAFQTNLGVTTAGGNASHVAVAGNRAYFSLGADGVSILEWGAGGFRGAARIFPTAAPSTHVATRGDRLFVSEGFAGVEWFAGAQSGELVRRGGLATPGFARAAAASDSCLYIADASAGLVCVAIGDSNLTVRTTVQLPGSARDVTVNGSLVLVADGTYPGVHVIDVSDIDRPRLLASLETPDACSVVRSQSAAVFAACGAAGIVAVDITRPNAPFISGRATVPGLPLGIDAANDRVFATTSTGELAVVDRQSNGNLTFVASTPLQAVGAGVAASGDTVVCAEGVSGAELLRISPFVPAATLGSANNGPSVPVAVGVAGNIGYLCGTSAGLWIYDVSDPRAPQKLSAIGTPGVAWAVAIRDNLAYVAGAYDGTLSIIDVTDPRSPVARGGVGTPDDSPDVVLRDHYAFVAQYSTGLTVVDVTDPDAPAVVATVRVPGGATAVRIQGQFAYLASYQWGMNIVDISNPAAPVLVGGVNFGPAAFDIDVEGGWVYAACDDGGFRVINAADPTAPAVVAEIQFDFGQLPFQKSCLGVRAMGGVVYLSVTSRFYAIDVRDPRHPKVIGWVPLSWGERLTLENGLAYVADINTGLSILPTQCGYAALTSAVVLQDLTADAIDRGVRLQWRVMGDEPPNRFYITREHPVGAGFVPVAAVPEQAGTHWMLEDLEAVDPGLYTYHVSAATAYGASGTPGSITVNRPRATTPLIGNAIPNPAHGAISFAASPRTRTMHVRVCDAAGRIVRSLQPGASSTAAPALMTWDGKDDRGLPVASGVYFLRAIDGQATETRRVTLVR